MDFCCIHIQTYYRIEKKNNFIVVYNHAGLENFEYPLPEWRDTYKTLIDYGVDLIIGSHPHVIQGKEQYKDRWIYYSLGNFIFNSPQQNETWYTSLHLKITFDKTEIRINEYFTKALTNHNKTLDIINIKYDKFLALNNILLEKNINKYIALVNQKCVETYYEYYEGYYTNIIEIDCQNTFTILLYVKNKFSKLFRKSHSLDNFCTIKKRSINNPIMLMHNIKIETHNWVVQRALSIISKTY